MKPPVQPSVDSLLSSKAAGRVLGVGPTTIQRWIDRGYLPAHRTQGGHRRVRLEDLVVYARVHGLPLASEFDLPPASRCILVIDDDRDILDAVALRLRGAIADADVITVDSAFKAGFLIHRFRPPVVLLDIRMPALSGIEVCRLIKAEPSTAQTRVIGITASRKPDEIHALLEAGAEEVLAKPFNWDALLAAVRRHLPARDRQPGFPRIEDRYGRATA